MPAVKAAVVVYLVAAAALPQQPLVGESVLSVAIVDQLSGATGFARAKIAAR